jgi:hypothetical protein
MWLEEKKKLPPRFLPSGVAVRVCHPSGSIRPVLRHEGSSLREKLELGSHAVDTGVAVAGRAVRRNFEELKRRYRSRS